MCPGAGQRAPGQGTEMGERDAGMVKQDCPCTVPNPVGGLGAEAVHTGKGPQTDGCLVFFIKPPGFSA